MAGASQDWQACTRKDRSHKELVWAHQVAACLSTARWRRACRLLAAQACQKLCSLRGECLLERLLAVSWLGRICLLSLLCMLWRPPEQHLQHCQMLSVCGLHMAPSLMQEQAPFLSTYIDMGLDNRVDLPESAQQREGRLIGGCINCAYRDKSKWQAIRTHMAQLASL